MQYRVVSFDLETELIAPGRSAPKIVCGAFWDGAQMHVLERRRLLPKLIAAVKAPDTYWVNQNIFFDFAALANAVPELLPYIWRLFREKRVYCTQVAEQLRLIAEGTNASGKTSLYENVFRHFKYRMAGKKEADAWRFRYAELDGLDIEDYPPAARDYVAEDVDWALKVYRAQGRPQPTFYKQMEAAWVLYLMGAYGMRVDPWMAQHLKKFVKVRVAEDELKLKAHGIYRPNGSEDKSVVKMLIVKDYGRYREGAWQEHCANPREALVDLRKVVAGSEQLTKILNDLPAGMEEINKLKLVCSLQTPDKIDFTAKGGIKTSKTVLKASTNKVLQLRATAGVLKKIWEQYVPLLARGTQYPINPRWNVLVNSGRTSCGNPNLQNLPQLPGVREAFVPHRAGHVFIASDYSTAELRSLAEVCYRMVGFSVLGDTIKAGQDPHVKFVAEMLGQVYDAAVALVKAGDKLANKLRKLAKALNFGLPGGLGAEKFVQFAAGMDIKIAEFAPASYWPNGVVDMNADEDTILSVGVLYFKEYLKPKWLDTYPEIREYFRIMGDVTKSPYHLTDEEKKSWQVRYVHPVSGFVRGDVQYCSGCNHNFQHLTAMGAKDALVQIGYECYVDQDSVLFGCRIPAFIHDEVLVEVPEGRAVACAKRIEQIMKQCMDVYTPNCPSETDAHIMRRWRKSAKQTYKSGILVPYEDRDLTEDEIRGIKKADSVWRAVVDFGVEPERATALRT